METAEVGTARRMYWRLGRLLRKFVFSILSVGPVPTHIAFILDGNRRFAQKHNLPLGAGHNAGFLALMVMVTYCYELGVKYMTAYAFSIDNFRRKPEEVEFLMNMMTQNCEILIRENSLVHHCKVRVHFSGALELLSEPVRNVAERLMACTRNYSNILLNICLAYTSTNEIMHSTRECCKGKCNEIHGTSLDNHLNGEAGGEIRQDEQGINLVDIERNMYLAIAPDPDILIRTSGETRLSNFLLWQSACCLLYNPRALWPEIGLVHLVWAVLNFQQKHFYLERKKKQM